MSKVVWIINHYATGMYYEHAGRHYYMAKYLKENGYSPIIICANIRHNSNDEIPVGKDGYIRKEVDGIPFYFIKIMRYGESRVKRTWTMFQFYKRTLKVSKILPKPYAIIGSSVHPLACVAAIKCSRKIGCKSICEIRDLWPETLVAYGIIKRNGVLARGLYSGEKWIYKNADKVVMTMSGGYDYIKDCGWSNEIPSSKVVHICNGVDLKDYKDNLLKYPFHDDDLDRKDIVKFIYTGSIRYVNNLQILVDAAEILAQKENTRAQILIWGDGDERSKLEEEVKRKGLKNIIFKGKVNKEYIPSILSQGSVLVLHNLSTSLDVYGQSQNKFFEYLAASRPILMTHSVGHSVCKSKKCGIELSDQSPQAIAEAMIIFSEMKQEEYDEFCNNAADAAREFDYRNLAEKMISVIEKA